MTQRIKKLLVALSDGEWHVALPKGVGPGTINVCIDQGLVHTKRVDIRRDSDVESYRIALHISSEGKEAIKRVLLGSAL